MHHPSIRPSIRVMLCESLPRGGPELGAGASAVTTPSRGEPTAQPTAARAHTPRPLSCFSSCVCLCFSEPAHP